VWFLRTCTVAAKDIQDVEHSVEVTAETLYEAIATALAALQKDNWVGEIGQGFTTVSVLVQQSPVKHEVRMTPRRFSRRSHAQAKAGEDIGQGEPREDVTEKAKVANHTSLERTSIGLPPG
jgi:hypothetical protein